MARRAGSNDRVRWPHERENAAAALRGGPAPERPSEEFPSRRRARGSCPLLCGQGNSERDSECFFGRKFLVLLEARDARRRGELPFRARAAFGLRRAPIRRVAELFETPSTSHGVPPDACELVRGQLAGCDLRVRRPFSPPACRARAGRPPHRARVARRARSEEYIESRFEYHSTSVVEENGKVVRSAGLFPFFGGPPPACSRSARASADVRRAPRLAVGRRRRPPKRSSTSSARSARCPRSA